VDSSSSSRFSAAGQQEERSALRAGTMQRDAWNPLAFFWDAVAAKNATNATAATSSGNATTANATTAGNATSATAGNASANATENATNVTGNATANTTNRSHAEIFNCQADLARRDMSWSRIKKDWCCEHKNVSCKIANTTAKLVHPEANTSAWAAAKVNHTAVPSLWEDTLSEVAMEAAKPSFDDMDCITKDGIITIDEAATFGTKTGVPWGEVKPIFDAIDMNKDGNISREEWNEAHPVSREMLEDLRAGFKDIDLDANNMINDEEWLAFCNGWMVPKLAADKCHELFVAADVSLPTGSIDRTEFEGAGKGSPVAALLASRRKGRGVLLTLVQSSSSKRTHPAIQFLGASRE